MNAWARRFASLALQIGAAQGLAGDLALEMRDLRATPVADALLHAEPVCGTAPAVRASTRATIDQVNKEFVPRVSVVQAGTQIHFPNSDNIRHSIYPFPPAKTFTTKLYSGRETAPVLFDHTGLVVLGCNIHDQMVVRVLIVDSPRFAHSGAVTLRVDATPLRRAMVLEPS